MMALLPSILVFAPVLIQSTTAQQIWDIWQTTYDLSSLFADVSPSTPINFTTPGATGDADISVSTTTAQTIAGFGGSLTDSAAQLLSQLKSTNEGNYNTLLSYMFDTTDGANAAGLSYLRVPLGATDFSATEYTYDDDSGDTGFSDFSISAAPDYVFSTIQDIMAVNPILKVHVLPWSPPGWMKNTTSMNGGGLDENYVSIYANYLLKCLQGFQSNGITPYAISIQNEPQNSDTTYPTSLLSPQDEATIGEALRPLMNSNGFSATLLIGYEHNWINANAYPVELMQLAESSFNGVAFHCYEGAVQDQQNFTSLYPSVPIYMTECTGEIGSDFWSDVKWYIGSGPVAAIQYGASAGLMWNIALDGSGQPELSGSDSCSTPCRGIVTINSDGSYTLNQEFYALAQAAKGTIPKDSGGPWAQWIPTTVTGDLDWALVVNGFKTGRADSSDPARWSLVVMNWDDTTPTPVEATIEFQGAQATYTFPVGVTTLWWFA